jgi:hypothetical protein
MATRLLPLDDVRFGYGIAITFGGIALVTGMPLAGLTEDFFYIFLRYHYNFVHPH